MAEFDLAHWFTARYEGGISDHPADRGGYTAFGISTEFMKDFAARAKNQPLLASLGLSGTVNRHYMKKITAGMAAKIFRAAFWNPYELSAFCQQAATVIYDTGVNCGGKTSLRLFQQAINAVSGANLAVDGIFGPKSRQAIGAYGRAAAERALALRISRYHEICARNPSQKVFLKGWLNRVNDLQAYIAKMP